jgi:hypothetical protein
VAPLASTRQNGDQGERREIQLDPGRLLRAVQSHTTSVSTYRWSAPGCTEALALSGGCDYVPGAINLDPNGPEFQSILGGSNGATNNIDTPRIARLGVINEF